MIQTDRTPRSALTGALRAERSATFLNGALQVAAAVYQAVALFAFVASLFLAASWLKVPFIGAFFEQTMVFNGAKPTGEAETWFLYDHGVGLKDQLVSVNNVPVHSAADVQRILQGFFPGETIPVGLLLRDGRSSTVNVDLNVF